MKGVPQFGKQNVNLGPGPRAAPFPEQIVYSGMMAMRYFLPLGRVAPVILLRQRGTFEEVVRDVLKR